MLTTPRGDVAHHVGAGCTKTMPVGETREAQEPENSSDRVSAGPEVHRGCKGDVGEPYFPVWQEWGDQEALGRESRTKAAN